MKTVLVSSCLLGEPVRYDGKPKYIEHSFLTTLKNANQLISVCPEIIGGLPIPRPAAEIKADKVINIVQVDVTEQFENGAKQVLELLFKHQIKMAILKARSPSCGNLEVYDGNFCNQIVPGAGITAKLLIKNGCMVFNEEQIDNAKEYYEKLIVDDIV